MVVCAQKALNLKYKRNDGKSSTGYGGEGRIYSKERQGFVGVLGYSPTVAVCIPHSPYSFHSFHHRSIHSFFLSSTRIRTIFARNKSLLGYFGLGVIHKLSTGFAPFSSVLEHSHLGLEQYYTPFDTQNWVASGSVYIVLYPFISLSRCCRSPYARVGILALGHLLDRFLLQSSICTHPSTENPIESFLYLATHSDPQLPRFFKQEPHREPPSRAEKPSICSDEHRTPFWFRFTSSPASVYIASAEIVRRRSSRFEYIDIKLELSLIALKAMYNIFLIVFSTAISLLLQSNPIAHQI